MLSNARDDDTEFFAPFSPLDSIPYVSSPLSLSQRIFLPLRNSSSSYVINRNPHYYSLGFTPDSLDALTKTSALQHDGCVNVANFDPTGYLLATGSDDHCVKIWKSPCIIENPILISTIHTSHTGNIFHVEMPNVHRVVSCGHEGKFLSHSLHPDGSSHEDELARHTRTGTMFRFAPPLHNNDDGQSIIYAPVFHETSTSGGVDLLDVRRSGSSSRIIIASTNNPVKCLDPSFFDHTLVIGEGADLVVYDIRRPSSIVVRIDSSLLERVNKKTSIRFGYYPPLSEPFWPCFPGSSKEIWSKLRPELFIPGNFRSTRGRVRPTFYDLNLSSVAFSPSIPGRLVASWQGDQIALYDLKETDEKKALKQIFCGQLNSMTILKRVSWFGPKGEFIFAGGDKGGVIGWDAITGRVVFCKPGDSYGDHHQGIVNGIASHPHVMGFVSYGLDSQAKVWTPRNLDDDLSERIIEVEEEAFDDLLVSSSRRLERSTTASTLATRTNLKDWRFKYLLSCRESGSTDQPPWNFASFWARINLLLREQNKNYFKGSSQEAVQDFTPILFVQPSPTKLLDVIESILEATAYVESQKRILDLDLLSKLPKQEMDLDRNASSSMSYLSTEDDETVTILDGLRVCSRVSEVSFGGLVALEEICALFQDKDPDFRLFEEEEEDEERSNSDNNNPPARAFPFFALPGKRPWILDFVKGVDLENTSMMETASKLRGIKTRLRDAFNYSHLVSGNLGLRVLVAPYSMKSAIYAKFEGEGDEDSLRTLTEQSLHLLRDTDKGNVLVRLACARFALIIGSLTKDALRATDLSRDLENALGDHGEDWVHAGLVRRFLRFLRAPR